MTDKGKSEIVSCARTFRECNWRKLETSTEAEPRGSRDERVNGAVTFIGSRSYVIPEDQTTMNNLAVSYHGTVPIASDFADRRKRSKRREKKEETSTRERGRQIHKYKSRKWERERERGKVDGTYTRKTVGKIKEVRRVYARPGYPRRAPKFSRARSDRHPWESSSPRVYDSLCLSFACGGNSLIIFLEILQNSAEGNFLVLALSVKYPILQTAIAGIYEEREKEGKREFPSTSFGENRSPDRHLSTGKIPSFSWFTITRDESISGSLRRGKIIAALSVRENWRVPLDTRLRHELLFSLGIGGTDWKATGCAEMVSSWSTPTEKLITSLSGGGPATGSIEGLIPFSILVNRLTKPPRR